ncbi:MAG: hypothetical protein AAB467_01755 [Patescibacteria group bacterium]
MMPEVVRWGPYHELQHTRRQDDLQHSYSLVVFTMNFIDQLDLHLYLKLEPKLLLRAVTFHDHGEAELKRDILLSNKSDAEDLREYLAFVIRFGGLKRFDLYHKAFLLQFVPKRPANFPPEAQAIMDQLAEEKRYEVLSFQAIENLDYLLYAIEQRVTMGNRDCLAQVFMNTKPKLDALSQVLPGLKQEFWTPGLITWCEEMVKGGNTEVPK